MPYLPYHLALRSESGIMQEASGAHLHDCYAAAASPDSVSPAVIVSCPGVDAANAVSLGTGDIIAMCAIPLWGPLSDTVDTADRKYGRERLLVIGANGYCAAPEIERNGDVVHIPDTVVALGDITQGAHWESTGGFNLSPPHAAYADLVPVTAGQNYSLMSSDNEVGYERVLFYNTDNPLVFGDYVSDVEDGSTKPLEFTVPAGATHMGINVHLNETAILTRIEPHYDSFTMGEGTPPTFARIAHNGRDAFIVTDSGTYLFEGYNDSGIPAFSLYNTSAVTDNAPWIDIAWQDGYFLWATADGRWGQSLLHETNFDASFFARSEVSPDGLEALISYRRRVYVFGRNSLEVWHNTGGTDFAFARTDGLAQHVGLKSRDSVAINEDGLFFVGRDDKCYMIYGDNANFVSTPSVEYDIGRATSLKAWTYNEQGNKFWCIRLDAGTPEYDAIPNDPKTNRKVWVYNSRTQLWHNISLDWVTTACEMFGRTLIAGGAYSEFEPTTAQQIHGNEIYTLSRRTPLTRRDERMMVQFVGSPLQAWRDLAGLHSVQVDIDIRGGIDGTEGKICLSWRDDYSRTFLPERPREGRGIPLNRIRHKWLQLGSYRRRNLRFCLSPGKEWVIIGILVESNAFQEAAPSIPQQNLG